MKWTGQNIYDQISRFRNDVYLEDLSTTTETSVLVVDSDGKVSKSTSVAGDLTSIVAGTGLSGTSLTGPIPTLNVDASIPSITTLAGLTALGTNGVNTVFSGNSFQLIDTTASSATEGGVLNLTSDDGAALGYNHRLGKIGFQAAEDASSTIRQGASIQAFADAAWSASENGTRLEFYTMDGNSVAEKSLTLDSDLLATFAGGVTVTGTITGNVTGDLTGEADTATTLATTRAIFGHNFDGSAALTGVIASANLDADTAHLTTNQTLSGVKTFSAPIISDGNRTLAPGDGAAIHVDAFDVTDGTTSASGTAAAFKHVSIETPRLLATNSSVTTTDAATLYVKGPPIASTNQTITNAYALWVDAGNARFDGNVEAASLTVGGTNVLTGSLITTLGTISAGVWEGTRIASASLDTDTAHLSGTQTFTGTKTLNSFKGTAGATVTNILDEDAMGSDSATALATQQSIKAYADRPAKQIVLKNFNFVANSGTTETFFPFAGTAEKTSDTDAAIVMIAPTAGKLLKLYMRASRDHSGQTTTITLYNWDADEVFSSGNKSSLGVQSATGPNTNEVVTFDFTSSLDSGTNAFTALETLAISYDNASAIAGGNTKYFFTAVFEYDFSGY